MKEEVIDGIKYRLDEENLTAEVTCKKEDYEGAIVIPETVVFETVSYRVTSIGDGAFCGCSSLTEITIPDSVVNIGCEAFDGCDSLEQKPAQEIEINKVTYRLLKHNHLAKVVGRFYSEDLGAIDILSEITYEGVVYRVTSIGEGVFCDCELLTAITIPNSIISIEDEAFCNCESLTVITIPESVISIGVDAFCGCDSLAEIVVEEGNPVYDSRKNCNAIIEKATNTLICGCQNTIIPDSVTCIGDRAFCYCNSLISITIPENVTSIGNFAFNGCDSLTEIVVEEGNPVYDSRKNCNAIIEKATNTLICGCQSTIILDSVTCIGDNAFSNCRSLTAITIPDSVTCIGDRAFCYCNTLVSITIPESVTSIGNSAFSNCESLTSITIPESVISIGDRAFVYCESLSSITIPESVTSIGNSAFSNCKSLTSITIPESVISIGNEAFYSCESLTSVILGNSVKSIGRYAFSYCKSLTSITIPESVTSIGDYAFQNCCKLADLTISDGVTTIGEFAFKDCKALTSVTIPSSVNSIGEGGTFQGCTSLKLVQWDAVNCITDENSNGKFYSPFCSNGSYCPPFYNLSSIKNFTFGNNVKFIPACLCCGLSGLTSILIPESVTSIGDNAFQGCCKLADLTISDGVTTIGTFAFKNCKALTSVTIPSSVKSIGEGGTFQGCTSLKLVQWDAINCIIDADSKGNYYPPFANLSSIKNFTFGNNVKFIPAGLCFGLSGLTSISIPESVTSIGDRSFKGCTSLKAIDIPDSVMIIEEGAFYGCTSLKIISIPSNAIIIEDGVFSECKSFVTRYRGTVEQCRRRYRYWDSWFHAKTIYCTDDDKTVYF